MRAVLVIFSLTASIASCTSVGRGIAPPAAVRSPDHIAFGGRGTIDAQLLDMTTMPDGRIVAVVCVTGPKLGGLVVLRWDLRGRLEARHSIAADCGVARVATSRSGETIVAASEGCGVGQHPEGCVILRRLDATLTAELWRARPQLTHLMVLAIDRDDTIAVGGWRSNASGGQDPTHTDVVLYDPAGQRRRTIEITASRSDLSSLAFVDHDVVVLGTADRGALTIDGTRVALETQSLFLTRHGARPWTYVLGGLELTSYLPPKLALPPGGSAVVVATGIGTVRRPTPPVYDAFQYPGGYHARFALRIDLASGKLLAGSSARVEHDAGPTDAIALPDGSILIAQRVRRETSERGPLCRGSRPCRYVDGPEAYGETTVPSVVRLDATTLAPIRAKTLDGHARVSDPRLVYAAATGSVLLGGSLEGTLEVLGGTVRTEARRDEPCPDDPDGASSDARSASSRDLFALQPPEPNCLVRVSYTSGVFVTRMND